ncbi:hypothetical protein [Aliarcobacter butzleri]|uniref:hypothetical protein n=1 Tax=Aliarcobacter butzleri TaxID=28197 RepID=UPI0021B54716|nr:hypothetical protein [Aliarcobacter butzleri]MCT7643867.1 hypothetical protein [Aliarcobacter butzleri]
MSAVLNSSFLMQILGANTEKELFAKLDIEHKRYVSDGLSLDIIDEIVYFCNERIINLNYVFISKERR